MSSGYFPVSPKHQMGQRLLAIIGEIDDIREEMAALVRGNCTPEDAMVDGSYLERLYMAGEFVAYCIEPDIGADINSAARTLRCPEAFGLLVDAFTSSAEKSVDGRLDESLKSVARHYRHS